MTGWKRPLGAAVVVVAVWVGMSAAARAETLVFKNDTKVALVVQAACVVNGKVKRDQPMLVQPGGVGRVVLPGDKLITVYDARQPNIFLFQGTLPATNEDQVYSMQPDPLTGQFKMERIKLPNMPNP